MAKVLGESGRYLSQEAARERNRIWRFIIFSTAVVFTLEGALLTYTFYSARRLFLTSILVAPAALILLKFLTDWALRKVDKLEKKRAELQRGAAGEIAVGLQLEDFPDEFRVINDLTTPFGNLDHVVIGPTGVFVLDTKNWRGIIAPDGNGELLLNNRPTTKPAVRPFVSRMLHIQEKVECLTNGLEKFYQAVFVFTSAKVDAKPGSTGAVHCIQSERLHSYVVEKDSWRKLSPAEVDRIAQAFLALAQMDTDFAERPSLSASERSPTLSTTRQAR